ncbi:MAG: hypothetical protein ABJQ29_12095 [Luteolibacter sp.]
MKWRNRAAIVLLIIGLSQMAGYILKLPALRGIGLASGVAPFTKVFSETDGYEAFAATFTIQATDGEGNIWSRELDAEWYSQLRGPYNRRNVYGAALAFAPRLPEELREEILREALKPGSKLREELGLTDDLTDLKVIITPRDGEADGQWTFPTTPL